MKTNDKILLYAVLFLTPLIIGVFPEDKSKSYAPKQKKAPNGYIPSQSLTESNTNQPKTVQFYDLAPSSIAPDTLPLYINKSQQFINQRTQNCFIKQK